MPVVPGVIKPGGLLTSPTFLECLERRCEATPDALAYTFLNEDGTEGAKLTYAEVRHRAKAIAKTIVKEIASLPKPPAPETDSAPGATGSPCGRSGGGSSIPRQLHQGTRRADCWQTLGRCLPSRIMITMTLVSVRAPSAAAAAFDERLVTDFGRDGVC